MAAGYTSKSSAGLHLYIIKAVHKRLPVTVKKNLYDKLYPSVLYFYCGEVVFPDHVFVYSVNTDVHESFLTVHTARWIALTGAYISSSLVLQTLCSSKMDVSLHMALCKSFVLREWFYGAFAVFDWPKNVVSKLVTFVHDLSGLVCDDSSPPLAICGLPTALLDSVIRLLGIAEAFGISFEIRMHCLFYSGISDNITVMIGL
ncbi:hypothetical protein G9A89_010032 [Geosiphon pyriformis]|nr:hypothetical protein G9A89_010032 [Geosiphon pyriformis]